MEAEVLRGRNKCECNIKLNKRRCWGRVRRASLNPVRTYIPLHFDILTVMEGLKEGEEEEEEEEIKNVKKEKQRGGEKKIIHTQWRS